MPETYNGHLVQTYKDGFVDIPYCTLCNKEGMDLNGLECSGVIENKKTVDTSKKKA